MTGRDHISADEFYAAFCEQWKQDLAERTCFALSPYECRKTWTNNICSPSGLLSRVTERLKATDPRLSYRTEWYTVDGLIVGGDDTYRRDLAYPSKVYALIEHELGTDIETEAWKLAHWLSPLKVLIFYDWCESLKINDARRTFLDERIGGFWSVVEKIRDFHPEPEETEYLLIVGKSATPGDQIVWERTSNKSFKPKPLRGSA